MRFVIVGVVIPSGVAIPVYKALHLDVPVRELERALRDVPALGRLSTLHVCGHGVYRVIVSVDNTQDNHVAHTGREAHRRTMP